MTRGEGGGLVSEPGMDGLPGRAASGPQAAILFYPGPVV